MRRASPWLLPIRMALAVLLAWGASGTSLAYWVCSGDCPGEQCPKHRQLRLTDEQAPRACCQGHDEPSCESEGASTSGCKCELRPLGKSDLADRTDLAVLLPPIQWALPAPELPMPELAPLPQTQRFFFFTDASPPDGSFQPDRGRAPPLR